MLLALAGAGCRSEKKNMPYPSGFQMQPGGPQAMPPQAVGPQGMFAQPQPQTVFVQGNVKNHVIGWSEDLTLAQALLSAEYRGITDPHTIVVVRQGQATMIDMKKFLRGKENPLLLPGDIIELRF